MVDVAAVNAGRRHVSEAHYSNFGAYRRAIRLSHVAVTLKYHRAHISGEERRAKAGDPAVAGTTGNDAGAQNLGVAQEDEAGAFCMAGISQ